MLMLPIFRPFLRALLFLCLVCAAGVYLWVRSSLPITDGSFTLLGLTAPVTITRDAHGIPTIRAQNDRDAAFALGFVHAQDRLFQMDLMRHYGAGKLAEWFGARALATDRSMRTLGLYRAAEAQYALLSPRLRAVFDAYAAGVNAFLSSRRGALPPEYAVLGVRAAPWRPADSLVWGKLMDLQLTGNYRLELLRARLARILTSDEMKVLFPAYPSDAPVVLGEGSSLLHGLPPQQAASNEWVVDGKHSVSGKPLLANDTHLDFSAPGIWYLARIKTPQHELTGVTAAGVPMVLIGHNRHIAWGFTTTGGDVEDVFIEKVDPKDPDRYLTPNGSAPFATRQEQIEVRGATPVTITIRATRHGPVISAPENGEVMALSATWLQGDDDTPDALWDATHAQNWTEFRNAFRNAVAPEQNIVYADIDGNIGFLAPAKIPLRKKGDGVMPVPGWNGEFDWKGYVPFDKLPSGYDPKSGRFFSGNNKIVPDSYPYLITRDWELPYRAERIGELLAKTPVQSVDTTEEMQRDKVSLMARQLLPLMLQTTPGTALGREALQRLTTWNDDMTRDAVEPLLFTAWLRAFNRQIFADRLGALFDAYWSLHPDVIESILKDHPDWCSHASAATNCAPALGAALDQAVGALSATYGTDMATWHWGAAHEARFPHPLWSHLPLGADWLALKIPDGGGFDTLDNGAMRVSNRADPYAAVHGPTLRMIVDMAAPDQARFMIVPGESGNILSRHYSDLMTPWRDVNYIEFSNDASGGTLTLMPSSQVTVPIPPSRNAPRDKAYGK